MKSVKAERKINMTLHIEDESNQTWEFDWQNTAKEVIDKCLEFESCPFEPEIDLLLTTNEEIHRLNLEYRGIDRPTDVLSFPLVDYNEPGNFSLAEENEMDYFNPETGELMLGDIIISVETLLEQAEKYGHSVRRELAFLIAHSMFHLMGYDHMEQEEARIMEKKQEAVLDELEIRR